MSVPPHTNVYPAKSTDLEVRMSRFEVAAEELSVEKTGLKLIVARTYAGEAWAALSKEALAVVADYSEEAGKFVSICERAVSAAERIANSEGNRSEIIRLAQLAITLRDKGTEALRADMTASPGGPAATR